MSTNVILILGISLVVVDLIFVGSALIMSGRANEIAAELELERSRGDGNGALCDGGPQSTELKP